MKKYFYFLVMLVLGTTLTACTEDWWEDKKFGNDLTLDDVTVKGNVVFVYTAKGKTETLYLDSLRAENTEITLNDTLERAWSGIEYLQVKCDGTRNTYRRIKERKGNLRIYEALFYTMLNFDGHIVPLTFTHDIVGVVNNKGQEVVREPAYQYTPLVKVADWQPKSVSDVYGQVTYHLQIEVTDSKIPVGTIDIALKTYALNYVYIIR